MPWKIEDVESHIKGLTDAKKRQWLAIANPDRASCIAEGGDPKVCDVRAIKLANGVLRKALGEGQGVGGDLQGVGGTDVCVCPQCGYETPHERGTPCAEMECPECGAALQGKLVKAIMDADVTSSWGKAESLTLVSNFVSLVPDMTGDNSDVVVRASRAEGMFQIDARQLQIAVQAVLDPKQANNSQYIPNPQELRGDYIPLYDLVLQPHPVLIIHLGKEKRHRRDRCMQCDKPPTIEVLWAEGIGHAWFCAKCFKEWGTTGDGKGEINATKKILHGVARRKWSDQVSPTSLGKADGRVAHVSTFEKVGLVAPERAFAPIMYPDVMPRAVNEATSSDDILDSEKIQGWLQKRLGRLVAEPKYAGWRGWIQKKGDTTSVLYDGSNQNRWPALSQADPGIWLNTLPDCILDCHVGLARQGHRLTSLELEKADVFGELLPEGTNIVISAFDLLYWDGVDYHTKSFGERREQLKACAARLRKARILIPPEMGIDSESDLQAAWGNVRFGKADRSEGLVLRDLQWPYELVPGTAGGGDCRTSSTANGGR